MRTAVVCPHDRIALSSAVAASSAGLIVPVLVGDESTIAAVASIEGLDISGYEILGTAGTRKASALSVEMARTGKVAAIMKGSLRSDELLHAVVLPQSGLHTERRISHAYVLELERYPDPIIITDAVVNIAATLGEKRDIVQNAIDLYTKVGLGTPRVAILSAVETVTSKIPSTIEAAALCKMADRGQITGGILDGPLAFDNAIDPEAARIKGIHSEVAGRAQILVVPDLEAGNMLAKNLIFLAKADAAGIVLGARVPVILTSRADSVMARMASCAVAVLYANALRTSTPTTA
jgi:phosphate acetyltransferase